MKRILSLIMALAMLLSLVALTSCDFGTGDGSSSEKESTESQSSSSEKQSESEKESESEAPKDPADIVDPNAPEDEALTLFGNESSDYVIIYDEDDEASCELADALIEHVQAKYSVTLEKRDKDEPEAEHEIVIGNLRENAQFVVNKLYENNDFAISVCGDDLVLYATSRRLYDFMLAITKELLNGNRTEFTSQNNFIYHRSTYKETPYAGYLNKKNNGTTADTLKTLFEACTYTASDGKTVINYRIYIPSSYYEGAELPVVTFLHGAGERGSNNESQLINMLPELFSQGSSPFWNAIVIAPQCPGGNQWVDTPWGLGNYSTTTVKESNELKAVVEIINEVKADYSTDENRYYAMGLSMGGFGTWDLIMRHSEMFAAAMPLCGGADPEMASKLVDFPIWTFHGTSDTTVPYTGTRDMVKAIEEACATAGVEDVITLTPVSAGHTIWSNIGKNGTYSRWLFNQSLENRSK